MIVAKLCIIFSFVHAIRQTTEAADSSEEQNDSAYAIYLRVKMRTFSKIAYRKFQYNYHKIGACELRYYQKRALCEQIITSDRYAAKFVSHADEFADLSCRRIVMDASDVLLGSADAKAVPASAYVCPIAYRHELAYDYETQRRRTYKVFVPVYLHVIGGVYPSTVIVSYQHVGQRTNFKPNLVVFEVPISQYAYMLDETRNEKYVRRPDYYFRRVKKQTVERQTGFVAPVYRFIRSAEIGAIRNAEIKRMQPYTKFRLTYKILNISSLKMVDKMECCRQVFENKLYKFQLNTDRNIICDRIAVTINILRTTMFANFQLTAIQCPGWDWGTVNSFFVASSFHSVGLIALMRIHPFPEILPDAVITEVRTEHFKSIPSYLQNRERSQIVSHPLDTGFPI